MSRLVSAPVGGYALDLAYDARDAMQDLFLDIQDAQIEMRLCALGLALGNGCLFSHNTQFGPDHPKRWFRSEPEDAGEIVIVFGE